MNRRSFLATTAGAVAATTLARAQDVPKKYRACIIGDTAQGGYGHSLHMMWSLRDDIEVVGLADPVEAGRVKAGEEAGAQRLYADYREMLAAEKPELVAIGPRWTTNHKEYLLACAEAGAHGLVEKPLAVDLAEIDEIIAAMDAKRLKWTVAFNFRASPVIHHLRKVIFEDKLLGDVLEMRARGKEDRRAGGEDLIVLGIHLFDIMIWLAGMPEWCWADVRVDGRPATRADIREASEPLGPIIGDSIQAVYQFPNNVKGFFASQKSADGDQGRWGLDIHGTRGIVTVRMDRVPAVFGLPDPTWAPGGKTRGWRALPGAPEVALDGPHHHYKPIVDELIAAIAEDREPDYSLRDARAAHEMVQAVFESALQEQCRVTMPLARREHPLGQ